MLAALALSFLLQTASPAAIGAVAQVDPDCQVWDWSGDPPSPCDGADGGQEEI